MEELDEILKVEGLQTHFTTNAGLVKAVDDISFSVKRGEVLAVCGPVGSGKSSLIQGLIREASPLSDAARVSTRGRVAYVPQTPFVLNTTLRENILFGLPFDQALYDRVLDVHSGLLEAPLFPTKQVCPSIHQSEE